MHVSINFNGAVDWKRMSGPSRMPVCLSCYEWTLRAPVLSQLFWIRVTFHLQRTVLTDKSPLRSFEYPIHFVIQAFSLHSFTTARTSLGHHVPTTDTLKYSTQSSHPSFRGPGHPSLYSDSLRAGLSGDQIPVRAFFPTHQDRPWGPPSLLYNGYRVSFPKVKRPELGVDHPQSSRAEVKERAELYLYYPSGPVWPALRRIYSHL